MSSSIVFHTGAELNWINDIMIKTTDDDNVFTNSSNTVVISAGIYLLCIYVPGSVVSIVCGIFLSHHKPPRHKPHHHNPQMYPSFFFFFIFYFFGLSVFF